MNPHRKDGFDYTVMKLGLLIMRVKFVNGIEQERYDEKFYSSAHLDGAIPMSEFKFKNPLAFKSQ